MFAFCKIPKNCVPMFHNVSMFEHFECRVSAKSSLRGSIASTFKPGMDTNDVSVFQVSVKGLVTVLVPHEI